MSDPKRYPFTSVYVGGTRYGVWQKAREYAKQHGVSLSQVITDLLRKWNREQAQLPYDPDYLKGREAVKDMTLEEIRAYLAAREALLEIFERRADECAEELERRRSAM